MPSGIETSRTTGAGGGASAAGAPPRRQPSRANRTWRVVDPPHAAQTSATNPVRTIRLITWPPRDFTGHGVRTGPAKAAATAVPRAKVTELGLLRGQMPRKSSHRSSQHRTALKTLLSFFSCADFFSSRSHFCSRPRPSRSDCPAVSRPSTTRCGSRPISTRPRSAGARRSACSVDEADDVDHAARGGDHLRRGVDHGRRPDAAGARDEDAKTETATLHRGPAAARRRRRRLPSPTRASSTTSCAAST